MGAMAAVHLSKVAVGCASVDVLAQRLGARAEGGEVAITTRYRPKRHEELVGGSLFWIIKHRLVARQAILGFAEAEGGRWAIRLDARLVPVRGWPKRVHQGWRYLKPEDAPPDLGGDDEGIAELPPAIASELARLALI